MRFLVHTFIILLFSIYESLATNVILVMADDQGWGQTGYYNHPILKTPHLDRMAKLDCVSIVFMPEDPFVHLLEPLFLQEEHTIELAYLICLLYTSPSPRDRQKSRMPSSA